MDEMEKFSLHSANGIIVKKTIIDKLIYVFRSHGFSPYYSKIIWPLIYMI
jgi:hypothetical protein